MKNNILVMGGSGFIGQNLVNYLMNNGYETTIYARHSNNENVKTIIGDVLNDEKLKDNLKGFDTIVYLICSVSPKNSMNSPNDSYKNEIPMLLKVLENCLELGIKRVVFASSGGSIYGECNGAKCLESDETFPLNHYAISKLACEKILILYNKLYGMENVILRISNPYGEGQKIESGIGVITTFIKNILSDNSINLLGDGKNTRDFIHIDAVCDAIMKSCFWKFNNDIIPIFNIGSGEEISLIDIINIICETLQKKSIINYLPSRMFDVKRNVLDIEKAKKYLNYNPGKNERQYIINYINNIKRERKL